MPSPFPGMDPYIEDPEVWSDFHSDLAGEIRARLNATIRPRYVARLTPYETVEIERPLSMRPDVGIWEQERNSRAAHETSAVYATAPVMNRIEMELPLELYRVEVLKRNTLERVTAIEILSPVNKKPGHPAYDQYLKKRRDLFYSQVHLIEIDLRRGGKRPPLVEPVPPAPYYIVTSRQEERPRVAVYPVQFADRLPVLPVPLLRPDPDAQLDLQQAINAVYERGGYEDLIDYQKPIPPPPLTEQDSQWIETLLEHRE